MKNILPFNQFVTIRRNELGIKSISSLSKVAKVASSTVSMIEKSSIPRDSLRASTLSKIGMALQVDIEKFRKAAKTWVVDQEELAARPKKKKQIYDFHSYSLQVNEDGRIPLPEFIKARMDQLNFFTSSSIGAATGVYDGDRAALTHLLRGAQSAKNRVSRQFLIRLSKVLMLNSDELMRAFTEGSVDPNTICIGTFLTGPENTTKVSQSHHFSLPLISALAEMEVTDQGIINRLAEIQGYVVTRLSKDTFICLIRDLMAGNS